MIDFIKRKFENVTNKIITYNLNFNLWRICRN